ncbi:MAG TPA: SDR family oxidoreductase [Acidimicrobiales bacterium]|jgi:NAD(P)-dependent dehydrogenase (short-subunit alcohol dehydrogenase family)|nr:SDR family oxidoreductase [Acidimicrobiales bacterium]
MSVAIVTGASRGLGQALASGLARAGWSVVIDGRERKTLDDAADRIRAHAVDGARVVALVGDITDADHRRELTGAASELGGLDLVVNNAGTLGASPLPSLADYPLDELRVAFEINVVAPLGLVQDALPLLLDSPHPRILDVTSDAGVEAYEGWGGYGAGKAALEHVGSVLAVEFPALTVWSVDPGDLRTAMHQAAFPGEDISDRPEPATVVPAFLDLIESERPSGRYRATELVSSGAVA